jgi:hypothetical protein
MVGRAVFLFRRARQKGREMARKLTPAQFERQLREIGPRLEARRLLVAYLLDRNSRHVLRAFEVLDAAGIRISKVMHRNLRHAIAELDKPQTGNSPRNTLRDLDVVADLAAMHETRTGERGALPEKIHPDDMKALRRRYGLTAGNVSQIVRRFRQLP